MPETPFFFNLQPFVYLGNMDCKPSKGQMVILEHWYFNIGNSDQMNISIQVDEVLDGQNQDLIKTSAENHAVSITQIKSNGLLRIDYLNKTIGIHASSLTSTYYDIIRYISNGHMR